MEKHHACLYIIILLFFQLVSISFGQLSTSETRVLLRLQRILEFPSVLQRWTNQTNFCYIPSSSVTLKVTCSGNHVTELTVVGNIKERMLSEQFSIDSLFTTVTKLSSLKELSLVSLGLWGSLPSKINRLSSLEVLNISLNFVFGEIPLEVTSLKSLKSLGLADNLLNGSVPDLSSLEKLEEIDVSNNLLGPKFPSLGEKILSIVLKNNTFQSVIPSELDKFDQLQHFDVSFNGLFGIIPSALFALPLIEYINLAGNKLGGTLLTDISCGDKLKFVDISHNRLVGNLPSCISYNSTERVVIYSWNCFSYGELNYQYRNSFCHEKALAVKPPVLVEKTKSSGKLGLIVGVVGAVIGSVGVLGLLIFVAFRKFRGRKTEDVKLDKPVMGESFLRLSPTLFPNATMSFGALGPPPYHVLSLEEIEEVTNYFDSSKLMGEGSQGQLYKGRLSDGSAVVVRCLKLKQRHSSQTFLQNVEILSKLRHRHLVSLLGHCLIPHQTYPNVVDTVFLVSEYVSNGTLRNYLTDRRKRDMLKWPERVAVAVGVARGLQFLHTGITPAILRNNLKMENILLDDNLTPKVISYNLSIPSLVGLESPFSGVETFSGRNGYTDSQIHDCSNEDGEKDDVYHLGIVLVEVLTGKLITSQAELNEHKNQLEKSLIDTASKLRELMDPSIRGTFAYESLRITVEIIVKCLSKDSIQRPSIEDVLWNLQYSVQVQNGWTPSSENLSTP
ncbi:hypothetical protein GIB67_030716 [Kingdonia uniflora]|uniref:non-specific serine/threonine protein kinase n=1 Tax=Kingdonia uniflora TaxID=39325 RepID=A0A7J7L307_9MAGN|nr:hypothetical protein GIB67_030716 [Kingdonia uniflora]